MAVLTVCCFNCSPAEETSQDVLRAAEGGASVDTSLAGAGRAGASRDGTPLRTSDERAPEHVTHGCQCVQAFGPISTVESVAPSVGPGDGVRQLVVLAPLSVTLEPRLRPPSV